MQGINRFEEWTNLKDGVVGHCVVHPKDPSGNIVGDQNIDSVMAMGDHDKDNAQKGD